VYPEENFGPDSRCYNSNGRPFCFDTICDAAKNAIMVKVGSDFMRCEYDGQRIDVNIDGDDVYFECPKKTSICPE